MNRYSFWLITSLLVLVSCQPQIADKSDLGALPTASFEILPGSNDNEFILKNTTEGGFITQWDLGDFGSREGAEITVEIPIAGQYEVSMTTFARAGSVSLTQTLTVDQDAPQACTGVIQLLTGCGTKTWKLANEEAALHVGPSLTETWWGNSSAELASRACHWDDEYIFSLDGTYEYDNKGQFFADESDQGTVVPADLGLSVGCHDNDQWPAAYASWGNGIHTYNLTSETLTVVGEGAWIGLYKLGTAGEVDTPQQSVTLKILEITENRMVLYGDYGWGVWRLTFTSN